MLIYFQFPVGRYFVTKLCQWQMLVLEVKKLSLHLMVLLSSRQGRSSGNTDFFFNIHVNLYISTYNPTIETINAKASTCFMQGTL